MKDHSNNLGENPFRVRSSSLLKRWKTNALRCSVAALAVVMLGGVASQPAFAAPAVKQKFTAVSLPKPSGKLAVGYLESTLTDRTRTDTLNPRAGQPRRLVVGFWYPAVATKAPARRYVTDVREFVDTKDTPEIYGAGGFIRTYSVNDAPVARGTFPLVLFSPGFGGNFSDYQVFAEELASNGYVVAAVHSPGISAPIVLDGEVYPSVDTETEYTLEQYTAWNDTVVEDLRQTLVQIRNGNALPSRRLGAALDLTSIAVAGHSFGGSAAVRFASGNSEIKAAVNIDGTVLGPEYASGLETNALFVRSKEAKAIDSTIQASWANLKGNGYLADQNQAAHTTFTDTYFQSKAAYGAAVDKDTETFGTKPAANINVARGLLRTYLNVTVKGQKAAALTNYAKTNNARLTLQVKP